MNFFVANPTAAFARVLGNYSFSNYHSLQIELRRRFSAGLQFQANYTLSRTLNDGTTIVNNQSTLESYRTLRNLRLDYQNSDQDQRQRFVANAVYDLPFGKSRRFLSNVWSPVGKVISGWTLGGIFSYQTGTPFYFTANRATFNNFNGGSNPADLVGVEGYRELITLYTTMFSDLRFEIHDIVAEGDIVCSRWTSVGTHDGEVLGITPTGNLLKRTGVSWQRIEHGKFVETWVERDGLGLARDIGVVPPH